MVLRRAKWALVIFVWVIFAGMSLFLLEHSDYGGGDFQIYYDTVRDYMPDQMPYLAVSGPPQVMLNYPPLLPQLLIPLVDAFDIVWAARIWFAFSLITYLALLAVLSGYLPARRRFAFWLLTPLFVPVFEALRIGQVNVLLLALIGFAWVAVKQDRRMLAGFLLAVASWIKIYPALILVYFLWKRNWRVTWGGFIGGVGLALFQIAISGMDVFVDFFRSLFLLAGQSEPHLIWKNNSIYGFAAKLFQNNERIIPLLVSPTLFTLTRFGLSALTLGVLFVLTMRSKPHSASLKHDASFDLEYALVVQTMLLLSLWIYADSISLMLIAYFILWRHARGLRIHLLMFTAGLLIFANYLLMWQPIDAFPALVGAVGFYALALLWITNAVLLARKQTVALPAAQESHHERTLSSP